MTADNDVKIFQSKKEKIIRSTYETVNDTEIVAIAKTAFTNLATSPQNLVCNKILLTSNANSYILLYRLCTETKIDWIFVLAVPQWTYISSTLIAVLVAVSGSLLIVTVGIIFGILFSVRIVQPFHQLIESFESVGQMDLDSLFIQKSSFSEVRELQKQFQFMVNRMKLYKSFIPSHLLSEIENGGEHDVKDDAGYHLVNVAASSSSQRTKGSCESFSKKSSNCSTQNMGSASLRRKYVQKDNKFQLYLEKRRITLVEILLEGLNDWLSILTPNETVMLLSDIFEQVNSICRSSGSSQISSLENDSLIIAFNATRNQNKHEEKAAHFCQVLNEKLLGVKYMKWKRIMSHSNLVNETSSNSLQSSKKFQPLNICDLMRFRFAITTCDSFCGNVGSQEMKQFSVLSSGKYNLSTMMEVAKKLNVNIVCSESVKRVCEKSFCMRYVDTQNLTDDSYVASYGNIGEDLSKLIPQTATHIYQLGQVLQVNQDEWMYELFEKEKMNEWNTYNQACQLYFERNYAQALEMFQEFSAKNSQDKPTEQMIQRCTLSL
ncbi:hypothetical protein C9374_005198 [Naegleria lovaniensis]|uniref:Guanylate cyclase domain-containing protein n=1 Tax=Naegleria lovaniensis TaxID=51637 RepID=A0AA88GR33_NAELO|nr:uncharacterized protein C9374_005198 [Naegleria lovaniensis]KAG2382618.1 hypothetical protein C9374_005198 [Naegleria lovaniensis]